MQTRSVRRPALKAVTQTLTAAVVLLALVASTVWEPAWAADSAAATPAAPTSSATTAPARAHEASKPMARIDLLDVERQQTSTQASPVPNLSAANRMLQRQGPVFIENRGQFDSRVKFLVKGNGADLWLTNEGIVFDFQRPVAQQDSAATDEKRKTPGALSPDRGRFDPRMKSDPPAMERLVFTQKFVGASANPTIEARDPQPGIYNYFPTRLSPVRS